MNITVFGASGAIGTHFIDLAARHDHAIRAVTGPCRPSRPVVRLRSWSTTISSTSTSSLRPSVVLMWSSPLWVPTSSSTTTL